MSTVLRTERRDAVALVVLDGSDQLNAMASTTIAQLDAAVTALAGDPGVRAVVVTGVGRAFSAGADISELATMSSPPQFAAFVHAMSDAFNRLEHLAKPVVAAINGHALGGGLEGAACDLRVVAAGARLGAPEVKLGLLPAAGGTVRLARLVPQAVAKHLLMTGELLTADDALRLGLVNEVSADADACVERALELAGRLATMPPLALGAAKHLVDHTPTMPFDEAVTLERETVSMLFGTADRVEGVDAFLAKRPPTFGGR